MNSLQRVSLAIALLLVCGASTGVRAAPLRVVQGSYVGDGQAFRLIATAGVSPEVVWLQPEDGSAGLVRTATMSDPFSKSLQPGVAPVSDGIVSLVDGGFYVSGIGGRANANGVTYHYVAMAGGAGEMAYGSYVGDGVDNRPITGLGMTPSYVMVLPADNQEVQHRFSFEPANASQLLAAAGAKADRIQDFLIDGFELGKNNAVNKAGVRFDFVAWSASSLRVAELSYAGDGAPARQIQGWGLTPDFVIVESEDASGAAVTGFASMGGAASLLPIGGVPLIDGISSLDPDGFTVESGSAVNRAGKNYYAIGLGASELLDLAVSKVVDNPTPFPGETVTFTVSVENLGAVTATNIAVWDSLPASLTYVGDSPSSGFFDPGTGVWTLPALDAGNVATLDIAASVGLGSLGRVLVNEAALVAVDQVDTLATNDVAQAAVVVGIAPLTVDIGVGLSLSNPTPAVGDTVSIDVTAQNVGADIATGTAVRLNLPSELSFVDAMPTQGSYSNGDWSVGTLGSGAMAGLKVRAVVAAGTEGRRAVVDANLAAVDQVDDNFGNNMASAEFNVAWVDVEVHAFVDNDRPLQGDVVRMVTYVRNLSPFDAFAVSLRDSLPAQLQYVSDVSSVGAYDAVAGRWNIGTLIAGAVDSLEVIASVDAAGLLAPFGKTVEVLTVTPTDVDAANDASAVLLQMAQVDLSLGKVADRSQTLEAEIVNFTVTVTNNGPDPATGVVVADLLPANLSFVGATPSVGNYVPATGVWSGFDLAVASTATLDLSAQVGLGTAGGLVTNAASVVTRDQLERNSTNDGDAASVQVVAAANASISVSATPLPTGFLLPGGTSSVVYELSLLNEGPVEEVLDAVTFTNLAAGPGSRVELDANWSGLWLSAGNDILPVPLVSPEFVDGRLDFTGLGLVLPVGKGITLQLMGAASLTARDGDWMDISIDAPKDLGFVGTPTLSGSFPSNPFGVWVVNGMTAAQIATQDLGSSTFLAGSQDNLALSFIVPPNGYADDVLEKINVVNVGDALPGADLSAVRAWMDDGDLSFDAVGDSLLGDFVFTGSRWELTGMSVPVRAGGRGIFVTVDIADLALPGRAVRMALPAGEDAALGMVSGNDGPVDRPVASGSIHPITAPDRVSLAAVPVAVGSVAPGETDVVALHVTLTNSYGIDQVLSSLRVANATTGPGTQSELDLEVVEVQLREDGDGDGLLSSVDVDPVLGSSFFQGGFAEFNALSWVLGPGESRELFVTFEVDGRAAADGDLLAARLLDPADVFFEADAAVAASWPLDSGAAWTVDGMLASQLDLGSVPAVALGPGEGPALALNVVVHGNGYQSDVLNGLTVSNAGTAVASDLSDVRLWRDGGDGSFDAGSGDDLDLGAMVALAGGWQSVLLNESVDPGGARFFVGVSTSAAPTDSATVRLQLPVDAVVMASGNDGPRDVPVVNASSVLLSQAPLLAQIEVAPPATTVGNAVSVRMIVRNVSGETVTSIAPSALSLVGDPALTLGSGPTPANVSLAPAARDTFVWSFDAVAAGQVQLSGNASGLGSPSGIVRVALPALSGAVQVFTQADSLGVSPVVTAPFSVNRGQTNVVPLSLTFDNSAGAGGSDVLLTGLRVRLENSQGAGIVPSSLLSRVVVNEGTAIYLDKTSLETTGAEVDLTLASAARVIPEEPATLNLQMDLLPTTVEPDFRVVVVGSAWVVAEDANSGAPIVPYLQTGSFPVASGLATVLAEAESLSVAPVALADFDVGAGQSDLLVETIQLTNVGVSGLTSDVRVSQLQLSVLDASGVRVADPSAVVSRIELRTPVQTHASVPLNAGSDSVVVVDLSPQVSAPVNAPLPLEVWVDTRATAPLGSYRVQLEDASTLIAADAITRTPVTVAYASTPLVGATWNLQAPATVVRLSGSGGLPANASAGASDLVAFDLSVRHPGGAETAAVLVDTLRVRALDENRQPFSMGGVLSGIRMAWNDSVLVDVGVAGGTADELWVVMPARSLAAGDTASIQLRVDLATGALPVSFELLVDDTDLFAHDANTAASVVVMAENGATLPVSSGLLRIVAPSTQMNVDLASSVPATLVPGQSGVEFGRVILTNPSAAGSSDLRVGSLTMRAADRNGAAIAVGSAVSALSLMVDGSEVATVNVDVDSTTATASFASLNVPADGAVEIVVRGDLRGSVAADGLRLGVGATDVGLLSSGVVVTAAAGKSFPLWTSTASFSVAELAESYANFPNPFPAGRGSTAFAYYLDAPAAVSLTVYTLTGETVFTLLDRAAKGMGIHQDDVWDGRNGNGSVVRNGVYLARMVVEFDDGRREELLRRVAVVR